MVLDIYHLYYRMDEFWLKYALRVAHIGSIIALSHKTISDYGAGSISSEGAALYAIFGIICMLSGTSQLT